MGNQLLGSSGSEGTPLYVTFGAGTKLSYTDGGNNAVSLSLTKGGVMEMFLSPQGVVEQLQLVGTVAAKSTLTGKARRGRAGTGRAILPAIGGSAGVRIRLKTPPFFIGGTSPVDAKVRIRLTPMVEGLFKFGITLPVASMATAKNAVGRV